VAVIPRRRGEPPQRHVYRAAYREQNQIERLFNRLTQHRAIATRHDKLADHYAAPLLLASIRLWL
jgi:transposase